MSDQVRSVDASMYEQAKAAILHQSTGEPAYIADTGRATEKSGGLVYETPTVEDDLPLQPPRRVDTEAGVRPISPAVAPQQIRPDPERRAAFLHLPINYSSRVNPTTDS